MDTLTNYEHNLVIETKSSHGEKGRKVYASYDGKRVCIPSSLVYLLGQKLVVSALSW